MSDSLIVITGAAGGLGKGLAQSFLAAGERVLLADIDLGRLESTYADVKGDKYFVEVDLTNADATATAFSQCFEKHGAPRVLCNIAGGFAMGDAVHEAQESVWQQMMDMNVMTLINASRATVPAMIKQGSGKIINVSAAAATSGKATMAPYLVSKSAVSRITESMALELREKGINVNTVAPSTIDTPANRAGMPDADPSVWVSPQQLSGVIGFLASDAADAVHGAVIPVVGMC